MPCQPLAFMLKAVERAFGGGYHFDVEAFKQRARAEGVSGELLGDGVEIVVAGLRVEPHLDAERIGEDPIEPHA